jgi:hypothetical protein
MSSASGGLLELVARGKKDVFFSANPQVAFFHSVYRKCAVFTKEIYVMKPRNIPEWGRYVDFDIDHRGDLMKNWHLRIQLPTWLPASLIAANNNGIVTDISGVTYGYCNNIGFQIIEKVQFFNDTVLIHETYGEYLDWRLRMSYEYGTTYLYNNSVGSRQETSLAIGRSSTAGILRVPLPFLGWQSIDEPGLPLTALRNCRYRVRIYLRHWKDLLTSSDGRLYPYPFSILLRVQKTRTEEPIVWPEKTLSVNSMKNIDISLETTVYYFSNSINVWLKATTFRFPFRNIQHFQYTLEDNIMNAVSNGTNLIVPIKLDFSGPADRLLVGFRSDASTYAGQRNVLMPPYNINTASTYVSSMRLNIANLDRIKLWTPAFYREFTSYWKNHKMSLNTNLKPDDIYVITFGDYDYNVPSGTLSFSRAVLPTLYINPAQIMYDIRNISRKTFVLIYCESWNVYEIANAKGRLLFDES